MVKRCARLPVFVCLVWGLGGCAGQVIRDYPVDLAVEAPACDRSAAVRGGEPPLPLISKVPPSEYSDSNVWMSVHVTSYVTELRLRNDRAHEARYDLARASLSYPGLATEVRFDPKQLSIFQQGQRRWLETAGELVLAPGELASITWVFRPPLAIDPAAPTQQPIVLRLPMKGAAVDCVYLLDMKPTGVVERRSYY